MDYQIWAYGSRSDHVEDYVHFDEKFLYFKFYYKYTQ